MTDEQILGFTAKRFHLLQLVKRAVVAIPGKNIYPLLANFQVVVGDGRLQVTATDMELSVVSESELVVCSGSGTLLLPAKRFLEILTSAAEGDVSVKVSAGTASITAGTASWSLVLQSSEDYPLRPAVKDIAFTEVSRAKFLAALVLARSAASRDGTNPRLMAISISGGKVIAGSHVRLHRVILSGIVLPDIQIPIGAVDDLVRLLKDSSLEEIGIGEAEHDLAFRIGSDVFMSGKLASEYPDMEKRLLTPPLLSNKDELRVDKSDLVAAIKRVRITADAGSAAIGLRIVPGAIRVISQDQNHNTACEEIPAQWSHRQRLLVVNHEHLADLLGLAEGPQVLFVLGEDSGKRRSPLVLKDDKAGTAGVIGQLAVVLIELARVEAMSTGVVKAWMEDRGFGFITEDGGSDVFVHVKQLPQGVKQLQPDTRVMFEKKQTNRGVQAFGVMLDADSGPDDPPDFLTEKEFLRDLNGLLPPLREVHKQALLDIARDHGWVD